MAGLLATFAIARRIRDGDGVGRPFMNRRGDQASSQQMYQKYNDQGAGESEHEPSHVSMGVE